MESTLETNFLVEALENYYCFIEIISETFLAERGRSEIQCVVERPKKTAKSKKFL